MDTRNALGIAISASLNAPPGERGTGVFRFWEATMAYQDIRHAVSDGIARLTVARPAGIPARIGLADMRNTRACGRIDSG